MTNQYLKEVILLSKWYEKMISDDEFLENFKLNKVRFRREVPIIAKEKLAEACTLKSEDMMLYYSNLVLTFVFSGKLDFDDIRDSIEKIITGNWHYSHEIIAEAFEDIASPKTIEWVYYLALAREYEGYEGDISMAKKCIHALGNINTPKSKEKLELLANNLNEDEEVRESAKRQLAKHDFTNKDVD